MRVGELFVREVANVAAKTRQFAWLSSIENNDAHWLPNLVANNPDWLDEVRILRKNECFVKQSSPRVMDEVGCEIHIGTLFFAVPDRDVGWPTCYGLHERAHLACSKKVSKMDGNPGKGSKGLKVTLLPNRLTGVEFAADWRCEISNLGDIMVGTGKCLRQSRKIQPLEVCMP